MTYSNHQGMTIARASLNVLQSAGAAAQSVWAALHVQAVRVEPNRLRFADGSTLQQPQAGSFIAC